MILVEVTGDPFWGTGLNVAQTKECLSDYWPGKNIMGQILMDLQGKIRQQLGDNSSHDEGKKCKATSPLSSDTFQKQKVYNSDPNQAKIEQTPAKFHVFHFPIFFKH